MRTTLAALWLMGARACELEPFRLRVEHLERPLGVDVARPRFSFALRPGRGCAEDGPLPALEAVRVQLALAGRGFDDGAAPLVWDSGERAARNAMSCPELQPSTSAGRAPPMVSLGSPSLAGASQRSPSALHAAPSSLLKLLVTGGMPGCSSHASQSTALASTSRARHHSMKKARKSALVSVLNLKWST